MSVNPVLLIELGLVSGTALGWGLYELYALRRDERRQREARERPAGSGTEPPDPETRPHD